MAGIQFFRHKHREFNQLRRKKPQLIDNESDKNVRNWLNFNQKKISTVYPLFFVDTYCVDFQSVPEIQKDSITIIRVLENDCNTIRQNLSIWIFCLLLLCRSKQKQDRVDYFLVTIYKATHNTTKKSIHTANMWNLLVHRFTICVVFLFSVILMTCSKLSCMCW